MATGDHRPQGRTFLLNSSLSYRNWCHYHNEWSLSIIDIFSLAQLQLSALVVYISVAQSAGISTGTEQCHKQSGLSDLPINCAFMTRPHLCSLVLVLPLCSPCGSIHFSRVAFLGGDKTNASFTKITSFTAILQGVQCVVCSVISISLLSIEIFIFRFDLCHGPSINTATYGPATRKESFRIWACKIDLTTIKTANKLVNSRSLESFLLSDFNFQ